METASIGIRREWAAVIKETRTAFKQWSQEELAAAAKVSVSAVQKMENGTGGSIGMYIHLMQTMKPKRNGRK
jgi:ribosome-binding protein aMBF1 (putative translation factor)